ncbi:hypothetical protein [Coraliomargarita parva]|uniref:hypothetical protein n=1 Tax=Coraliomargarita parva TaxID=3014050 RepID=UPI0022B548AC|nr:hypothetical protein [Coraliomargarita parva]
MKNIIIVSLFLGLFSISHALSEESVIVVDHQAGVTPLRKVYLEKYTQATPDLAAKKENTKTTVQFRDKIEAKKEEDELPEYLSGLATGGATGLFIIFNWAIAGLGAPFINQTSAIVLIILASMAGMLCTYSTRLQKAAFRKHIQPELDNA